MGKRMTSSSLVIMGNDNQPLLTIDTVKGTVEGPLENAGEAARVFVDLIRGMLTPNQASAAALKLREADPEVTGEWGKGWNACLDAANNELALRRSRATDGINESTSGLLTLNVPPAS